MIEFLMIAAERQEAWIVILLTAIVTYMTRAGGHVVLARFERLHPRVEAALEAVPAAVLITLVMPAALTKGPLEFLAILAAFAAGFRLSPMPVLIFGLAIVVVGRQLGF